MVERYAILLVTLFSLALISPLPVAAQSNCALDFGSGSCVGDETDDTGSVYGGRDHIRFGEVRYSTDISTLNGFVTRYPRSEHVPDVKARIAELNAERREADRLATCNGSQYRSIATSCSLPQLEVFLSRCEGSDRYRAARHRRDGIKVGVACQDTAVRVTPQTETTKPNSTQPNFKTYTAYTTTNVNLRSAPELRVNGRDTAIQVLPKGSIVTVLSGPIGKGYHQVRYGENRTGYVAESLLSRSYVDTIQYGAVCIPDQSRRAPFYSNGRPSAQAAREAMQKLSGGSRCYDTVELSGDGCLVLTSSGSSFSRGGQMFWSWGSDGLASLRQRSMNNCRQKYSRCYNLFEFCAKAY